MSETKKHGKSATGSRLQPPYSSVLELIGQQLQQLWVARWIVRGLLIDWLDQPGAEQILPQAVDGGAGEVGIFFRDHPLDQFGADIAC